MYKLNNIYSSCRSEIFQHDRNATFKIEEMKFQIISKEIPGRNWTSSFNTHAELYLSDDHDHTHREEFIKKRIV